MNARDTTTSLQPEPAGTPTAAQPVADTRAAGVSRFHESARAQVAGAATYIDDIPEVRGTLFAAPVCSPVAHGRLRGIDAAAALGFPIKINCVVQRGVNDAELPAICAYTVFIYRVFGGKAQPLQYGGA